MAKVGYRNVGKSYGSVSVIRNLSLDVEDGTFVVLLGASGCGKTTLLRMTAGLESISEGEVSIDGRVVNDVHPRDRDIAMVFQNYALYPTMSVRENIGFCLEVAKLAPSEIRDKVEEVARVLNLSELLDRRPSELSGGQRQRVAMGRAMVRKAKVFLFDEPLSNLDAKLRARMRLEIRQLHERLKATTIYVTHDQIEAMTMADMIVLMKDGSILQTGSPDDLFDHPNCLYVAEFVGTPQINILDGVVEGREGGADFVADGMRIPLAPEYGGRAGLRVACGIRPTDARVDPEGPIRGKLSVTEKLGTEMQLHVEVGSVPFVGVVSRSGDWKPGMDVRFAANPDQLHLFDAASGSRVTP